jgi:hypothetical protein
MAQKPARPAAAKAPKPAKPAKTAAAARPEKAAKPAKPAPEKPAKPAPEKAAKAEAKPAAATQTFRLKDLVTQVALATGAKKPQAKQSVEATLAALSSALSGKSALAVPPLGKLRVVKASGSTLTLKLRLTDAAPAKGLALAEDGEDS